MKLKTIGGYVFLMLFLTGRVCLGVPADDVEDLSDRDYFPVVLKIIEEAKEEILMVMYDISYVEDDLMSPVSKLLDAVVKAKDRGVKVKAVLELPRWEERKVRAGNRNAYMYLKEKGIDVSYDTGGVVTHSKLLVIDDKNVILGSANWSKKAMEDSNETNVLIVSPALAEKMEKRIANIKTQYLDDKEAGDAVKIPCLFISPGGAFTRMAEVHAGRAMDVYLYLVYNFRRASELSSEEVKWDFKGIAEHLGIETIMTANQYRRQIVKVMRKLDREYNLLKFRYDRGKDFSIKFIQQDGAAFLLPLMYWEYGWDKVLNLNSKICLFINLTERGLFQGSYQWEGSREFISKKYGISTAGVTKGMRLLQRYDVLDMEYTRYSKYNVHEGPTIYKYKGIYDLGSVTREMDKLREKYEELFYKAREYAGIIFKDLSPIIITRIIGLIQEYGIEMTDKAFRKANTMRRDNPKRNLAYIVGILRTKRDIDIPEE